MDLWHLLGDLHPKLVHFPLVLLLAGLLFDLAGVISKTERAHWAAKALTASGTVTLLFTFICGIYAEIWAGRALVPHHQIELHELAANIASWGFVILCAWRLFLNPPKQRGLTALYATIGLGWYVLLMITAHLGGQLITEYGAAVTGTAASLTPSLHDLNTLATRQTDENLRYSEMMHHIFGWLTLGLSGSLLAGAMFPSRVDRMKWVAPTMLLLGGVFLFFCADLDLYRLTDARQWLDREVQLHKTIALILAIIGGFGLRATLRRTPVAATPSAAADHGANGWAGLQARLIAVMALIGGGMLFTHVHTVAPYANVAAGVYVAHVTMGLVALSIGASSLLADAFPRRRAAFSLIFAVCMCAESVLLISYNEGLPWYIGYGRYNRGDKNHGPIAPYGNVRAEMTFDADSQTLSVRVLHRFDDVPVAIPARSVNLLVSRGYQETVVPLALAGSSNSHFIGEAGFLKDAPAFSARLALPVGSGGEMKMGYFDPWVIPVVAPVPPNEVARFVCPMHEGYRSADAGICKLCNMPLIPIDRTIRSSLHDANYAMEFSATVESTLARNLSLTPKRDRQVLHDLARVHEYLMHLMIVSDDLARFDHVHPQQQADGAFTISYVFPAEGSYLLYSDITPSDGRGQVFRLPVKVGSSVNERSADLELTPARAKPQAADPATTVELISVPRHLTAGTHVRLLFRIAENGRPVTDLAPYIGAMGHCVAISQDTQTYLHCHPEQLLAPSPDARGGPDVAFHTIFPKSGRYKVWGQFRRGDQILVSDFVIDVDEPLVPAGLMNFLLDD
jgi:uncharacterized membrane protein